MIHNTFHLNYLEIIFAIIPQQQPERLLTGTDFQQHISGLGNIWETFRACTAHSASMCQSIQFYSLLLSFLFFRVNTYRFTCLLAREANFAYKITNNLQNTKRPASYSRFSCKISRFIDKQCINTLLRLD